MAFSFPICYQNWYWLYQTLRGAFPVTVLFIFSRLWLLIQHCKIPASGTTQVYMLPSNWEWIHIPSAGICSTHCCAETPLWPMALLSPPWAHLFQGTPSHGSTSPQMHSVGWGWKFTQSVQLMFCSLSEIHFLPRVCCHISENCPLLWASPQPGTFLSGYVLIILSTA